MNKYSSKAKKLEPRRSTRSHILNITFQLEFLDKDTLFERLENYYEILNDEEALELKQNEKYVPYLINTEVIQKEVKGIFENLDYIDKLIRKYSIGWELSRIPKVDLAILRLAIYEIMFEDEIPNLVAINEAIEIAKYYSLENSSKFINGILGKVKNEQESAVFTAEKK